MIICPIIIFWCKLPRPGIINPFLLQGVTVIKQCARALARIQIDCGMSVTEEEYVESFNFGLVQVVYEWARGMPFKEITELTDVSEGEWIA